MLPLAHAGFGLALARPILSRIQGLGVVTQSPGYSKPIFWAVVLGSLAPDVLDKALFFGGQGWVPGTRTIGHTLLFWLVMAGVLRLFKLSSSRHRLALAFLVGGLTHLFLDLFSYFVGVFDHDWIYTARAFLWPLQGFSFSNNSWVPPGEYLKSDPFIYPFVLVVEAVGAALFLVELLRLRRRV